jgi:hypothetical protein
MTQCREFKTAGAQMRISGVPLFLIVVGTGRVGGLLAAIIAVAVLKSQAIKTSANRTAVSVTLPKAQLEPAVLNVSQSYVYAEQQGLLNRIGNFFSGSYPARPAWRKTISRGPNATTAAGAARPRARRER